jgi:heptosyltransferase-2
MPRGQGTIALFLPNWIGDVVMATPAIRAVRGHFPSARLLAVGKPYVAETLAGAPWFDDTIVADRTLSVAARLRQESADTAVLFPNSFRTALAARLGGCRTVVGFARYLRDPLLTRRLYPARDRRGLKPSPALDSYNRVVGLLGVPDPGHRLELFTTPADEAAADAAWQVLGLNLFGEVIGLNPGGAFGSAKHWPVEHFVTLARSLAERRGAGVVVLCGPAEREMARAIAAAADRPGVVSLADRPLSLGLSKAVVRRLALLVTTDSGPRHFAAAFGTPVVTLFGPTHIAWTETNFPDAVHLQKPVPCGPCQKRVCPLGHHRCMTEQLPAEVFAAVEDLLRRTTEQSVKEHRHAG